MKSSYDSSREIRCRIPASSVRFGVGAWMVIAGQSSWGKGAIAEDETRRGRKAASGFCVAARALARRPAAEGGRRYTEEGRACA